MRRITAAAALYLCLAGSLPAAAQAPRETRLLITVVDQSNAVLPGATVTATGVEDATRIPVAPVAAAANGIAILPSLIPGRYNVQAEFSGFEPGLLKDVRVRTGYNRHVIVLVIQKVQESVNVGQDAQAGAA